MPKPPPLDLSRRERQIMDVLYRRQRATAAEIVAELPDPPTYTTVRGLLRVLEEKGYVLHEEDGPRYVYTPSAPRQDTGASMLAHVVRTFFDGSAASAMSALLGSGGVNTSDAELARLVDILENARTGEGGQ